MKFLLYHTFLLGLTLPLGVLGLQCMEKEMVPSQITTSNLKLPEQFQLWEKLPSDLQKRILGEYILGNIPGTFADRLVPQCWQSEEPVSDEEQIRIFERLVTNANAKDRSDWKELFPELKDEENSKEVEEMLLESAKRCVMDLMDRALQNAEAFMIEVQKKALRYKKTTKKTAAQVNELLPLIIIDGLVKRLNNTYFFKGATRLHAALLLSKSPMIRQWLVNYLTMPVNYAQEINKPTDNILQLRPLTFALIVSPHTTRDVGYMHPKENPIVKQLESLGATADETYLNDYLGSPKGFY
jgi:hypothetical protein